MYSAKIAARVARVRPQTFQAWQKAGLLRPTRFDSGGRVENTYTYDDLLLMRVIVRLKEQGIRLRAIRTTLDTIEQMSNGDRRAWMRVHMYVHQGLIVVVFPDNEAWNPVAASRGPQKMAVVFFPELMEELKRELVPERFRHIDLDPEVLGGAPTVKGTRISTSAVASVLESGVDPKAVYPNLSDEQIREVDDYERSFLRAA